MSSRRPGLILACVVALAAAVTPACLLDGGPLDGVAGTDAIGAAGGGGAGGAPQGGARPATECGNGVVEPGEECEGTDLGGRTCAGLGHPPGELACTAACALDASGCAGGEAWWDRDFRLRKRITIDGAMAPEDLPHFTALVSIVDPALSAALPSGEDMVFVPEGGGEPLAREIEVFDPGTGTLVAWVHLPLLEAGMLHVITLYFGGPGPGPKASTPVWAPDEAGVWHLGEDAANGQDTAVHRSSIGKDHHGSQHGNTTVEGKIGRAQSFDGTDWIEIADGGLIPLSDTSCAVSAWIRTVEKGAQALLTKSLNGTHSAADILTGTGHDGTTFGMDSYYIGFVRGTTDVTDGTWHHVVWSQSRNTGPGGQDEWAVFIDGKKEGSAVHHTSVDNGGHVIRLGAGVSSSFFSGSWKGDVDELHISKVARTPAWVSATYLNQVDPAAHVTHGPIEKVPPPPP